MPHYSLPSDLVKASFEKEDAKVFITGHRSDIATTKNQITLDYHLFSFLVEGRKIVYTSGGAIEVAPTDFVLIPSGNCLMSELISSEGGNYSSIMLLFHDSLVRDFIEKYQIRFGRAGRESVQMPVAFRKDDFLNSYVQSLHWLLQSRVGDLDDIQILKVEELLLYLCKVFNRQIVPFLRSPDEGSADHQLRKVVTANQDSNLSIQELAFLCNTSLSTFKRRFSALYGMSPSKWMNQQKMERAASLLAKKDVSVKELYFELGYENLSSFIQSFKQYHGTTPKQYQLNMMSQNQRFLDE